MRWDANWDLQQATDQPNEELPIEQLETQIMNGKHQQFSKWRDQIIKQACVA